MNELPPPPTQSEPVTAPFFSVSLLKFSVLSVLTFGLYEAYCLYKNWRIIQQRTGEPMMPFWRAFFGYFWIYALLREVRDHPISAAATEPAPPLIAGPIAVAWIVITLLCKLPDPWWILSLLSFVPLLVAQRRINWVNATAAPQAPLNSRFTWANWIWIVIGIIMTGLAIIGTFLPAES